MTVLVVAEHDNNALKQATLNTITAALRCDAEVHVLVAGAGCQQPAQAAARVAGVKQVLHADGPELAHPLAENLAAQVLGIAERYSHILFAATTTGKSVAPRVAAKLNVAQISDVVAVEATDIFKRPIYAGSVIATVQSADRVKVLTVRTTAFDSAADGGTALIVPLEVRLATAKSAFVGQQVVKSERPELTAARIVVSGGRGLGSSDKFSDLLLPLAHKLGAAVGASRAAVDSGYAPNDMQVGQTGKIVAPDLYIAVGISGAIQHLAGMKDSKVIVAINKDAEAPIFSIADYGLVADLFEALPEMTRAFESS